MTDDEIEAMLNAHANAVRAGVRLARAVEANDHALKILGFGLLDAIDEQPELADALPAHMAALALNARAADQALADILKEGA